MRLRSTGTVIAAIALVVVACSSRDPDPSIQFIVETTPGQPWTAVGELVDAGVVCPGGGRRPVGFYDAVGNRMDPEAWFERFFEIIDAFERDEPYEPDIRGAMEFTCADGTGSFTIIEAPLGIGPWRVRDGTGAYQGMTGSGTSDLRFSDGVESSEAVELSGRLQVAESSG